MGCHRCVQCGQKFEGYDADEYAAENRGSKSDRDSDESSRDSSESEIDCWDMEGNYETCPECLEKAKRQKKKDMQLTSLMSENQTLRSENEKLKSELAACKKRLRKQEEKENQTLKRQKK
eukprot:gnl/MRDRNA2_/MRDRNA2_89272_c0_seq1.p1 gnl/MRDRNA2_/MRDRNA2_89272_c0~~gnl/MRDRNA2_/MRDRNA2_89272_c0_seq1.p1  ORF type:complete len:120 (-),score=37.81 gnl/MRDRNA2_/MRDRNA2_89272_c0_seq1:348-707(-)